MPLSTTLLIVFSLLLCACTSFARPSPSNVISDEKTSIGYFKSLTNDQPIPEALLDLIPSDQITAGTTGTKESNSDDLASVMGNQPILEALQVHLNDEAAAFGDHKNSIPYFVYFKKNFERKPNLGTWFYTPKNSEALFYS